MFTKPSKARSLAATLVAAVFAVTALVALTACDTDFNIVTNSTAPEPSGSASSSVTTIKDGTLTVGINASNSPFGGVSGSNNSSIIGLDADLAAAVADELGCKLELVDVGEDGRSAVEEGTVDVAFSVTKSGKGKTISYAGPYLNNGSSLFCLATNAPSSISEADFTDQQILVQTNSAASYEIQDTLGIDAVLSASTMQDAFQSLENGEATYLVASAATGAFYARDYGDVVRVDFLSQNDITPVYAATASSNADLATAVETALADITGNGTLRVIVTKWLGSQGTALIPGAESFDGLPQDFTGTPSETIKEDATDDEAAADNTDTAADDEAAE